MLEGAISSIKRIDSKKRKTKEDKYVLDSLYAQTILLGHKWFAGNAGNISTLAFGELAAKDTLYYRDIEEKDYARMIASGMFPGEEP